MDKKRMATGAVCLVIGAVGGYVGGNAVRPASPPTENQTFTRGTGMFGNGVRGGGNVGGVLSGIVATKDAQSITLDTRDGSSHVVLLTPGTTVQKSVSGSLLDVAVGSMIFVTGTANSDGSISASSIQLRSSTTPATMNR